MVEYSKIGSNKWEMCLDNRTVQFNRYQFYKNEVNVMIHLQYDVELHVVVFALVVVAWGCLRVVLGL